MSYGNNALLLYDDALPICGPFGKLGMYRDSLDHMLARSEDGHMRKLILIFLLACTACTTQAQGPGREDAGVSASAAATGSAAIGGAAGGDTLARIRALVGGATCTESGQCRTLPVGAMPCGGPESYLPYSTAGTDEKALRGLGEQYKAARQAAHKTGGMMSICRHLPDPGAVCVSGRCQLGASSPSVAR